MAFDFVDLSKVAQLNEGRSAWAYITRDSLSTVLAAGYFNSASRLLTSKDPIAIYADDGHAAANVALISGNSVVLAASTAVITADALAPGAIARDLNSELFDQRFSVKRFGAVGDGVANDAAAIDEAFAYATNGSYNRWAANAGDHGSYVAKGPALYFPPGNYVYDGDGLDFAGVSSILRVYGDSAQSARITIPASQHFINSTANPVGIEVSGLHFSGGAGAINFHSQTANVNRPALVAGCIFTRQTACALGHISQDWPSFRIERCRFHCADTATAVCLSGLAADGGVFWCDFQGFKYGLKLATAVLAGTDKGPATPINIVACSFYRRDVSVNNRFDAWIVPNAETSQNAGRSIEFTLCKFGNEQLISGDARVLVAAEAAGTDSLDKQHDATAGVADRHYVNGAQFHNNNVNNSGAGADIPFVKSYSARIIQWDMDDLIEDGQNGPYIDYDASLSTDDFQYTSQINRMSLRRFLGAGSSLFPNPTNRPGTWLIDDPHSFSALPNVMMPYGGGAGGDYINLLTTRVASFTAGNATTSAIESSLTDVADGLEVTATSDVGRIFATLVFASAVDGRLAWLEGDLERGATLTQGSILVQILDNSGNIVLQRCYALQNYPREFRIPFVVSKTGRTSLTVRFISNDYAAGTKTKFQVGRVRCYQAQAPLPHGRLVTGYSQTTVGAAGAASAMPTPVGYFSMIDRDGNEYVVPYCNKA